MCDVSQQAGDSQSKAVISRNQPMAARILRRWRGLTGGKAVRDVDRRAIVACSGGADSVALAAVLAMVEPKPTLVHVVHDIRASEDAIGDRDAVAELADVLGCPFVERSVFVKDQPGNLEHNAREARYRVLGEVARQEQIEYIATGHHGDDQLETMLMHLMRGAGVRGMGGMEPVREMNAALIVRPMLVVSRAEIEAFCVENGLAWRHDCTNDDLGFLRNRIRHGVMPMLREIEPGIVERASGLARSCQQASEMIGQVVHDGIVSLAERNDGRWSWDRGTMRAEPEAAIAELMFVYVREELDGVGADSIKRRAVEGVVKAIKSDDTDPRVHRVGPMVVHVQARTVCIWDARKAAAIAADEKGSCDE